MNFQQSTLTGRQGLNALTVTYVDRVAFVPLPRAQWQRAGMCHCPQCGGRESYWDTLAISREPPKGARSDTTWMVHRPEGHAFHDTDEQGRRWTAPELVERGRAL